VPTLQARPPCWKKTGFLDHLIQGNAAVDVVLLARHATCMCDTKLPAQARTTTAKLQQQKGLASTLQTVDTKCSCACSKHPPTKSV